MATAKRAATRTSKAVKKPAPDERAAIEAYLAALPAEGRRALERVRRILRKTLPTATEGISYGMPTFRVDGRPAVHLAAWKEHWAIYPASAQVVADLRDALVGRVVSKGTIRFGYDEPIPTHLLQRIALARAAEIAAKNAAPRAKKAAAKPSKTVAATKRGR